MLRSNHFRMRYTEFVTLGEERYTEAKAALNESSTGRDLRRCSRYGSFLDQSIELSTYIVDART